jgi:hypothetical protein
MQYTLDLGDFRITVVAIDRVENVQQRVSLFGLFILPSLSRASPRRFKTPQRERR